MIDLIPIGKLGKSHGVHGHIRLNLKRNVDLSNVRAIFVNVKGDKIPYFVDDIDGNSIKFDEISNPEDAKTLSGFDILLNRDDFVETIDESEELTVFVGYTLLDDEKPIGIINDVVEYPQQLMAVVNINDNEILIPLVEEFIKDINADKKLLYCQLPEGFIEAQLD